MNTEPSTGWERCQSDFLAGISSNKRAAKRRRQAARRVTAASACVAFLAIGVWGVSSLTRGPENYFGGVSCSQVRASLPEMTAGGLAPELSEQIETHLKQCPRCQRLLEEMRAMAPQTESVGRRLPPSPEASVASVHSGPARYTLAVAR